MADLNTIKYSTNPYNINRMTQAAGVGAIESIDEIRANCAAVCENRAWTMAALKELGFEMTDSAANFIFVRHPAIGGGELYRRLKEEGILVRHFDTERICDYIRITIGKVPFCLMCYYHKTERSGGR